MDVLESALDEMLDQALNPVDPDNLLLSSCMSAGDIADVRPMLPDVASLQESMLQMLRANIKAEFALILKERKVAEHIAVHGQSAGAGARAQSKVVDESVEDRVRRVVVQEKLRLREQMLARKEELQGLVDTMQADLDELVGERRMFTRSVEEGGGSNGVRKAVVAAEQWKREEE